MKAKIYTTEHEVVEVEPKNGTDFTLEEMQEIVGGFIEIVPLDGDDIMVINEEGLLIGLDINFQATELYGRSLIVGNALVCHKDMVK